MRRACYLVHLWVGLSLGLLAAVIGLSGSLLVFRHEIDALLAPGVVTVPRADQDGPLAPPSAIVAAAQQAHPTERVQHVMYPVRPAESVEVYVGKESLRVFIDPRTAAVLGSRNEDRTPMGMLFAFHTDLLSGDKGHTVAGITGLGLFVLSLTGLVVWWPRKRQRARDGMRVKWGAGRKRVTYDLHRTVGFFVCGLLVVISLTGAALVFPDHAKTILFRATGSGAPPPKPKTSLGPALPLDDLVAAAERAMPDGTLSRISFPAKPGDALTVRKRTPNETHPNGMNVILVDPTTAEVLRVDRDEKSTLGQRAMNARYPIHIGAWGGLASRLLHSLAGLTPAFLYVTGFMVWLNRRGKGKRRRGPSSLAERSEPQTEDPVEMAVLR